GNGKFKNRDAHAQDLGCDFGAELEAAAFELNRVDDVTSEDLIGGGLISDALAVEHADHSREDVVGNAIGQAHFFDRAEKPGAVNDQRPPLGDRFNQARQLLGRVFQIGILDQYDVALDMLKSRPDGGPLAAVDVVADEDGVGLLRLIGG